jgi:hypothetical protein
VALKRGGIMPKSLEKYSQWLNSLTSAERSEHFQNTFKEYEDWLAGLSDVERKAETEKLRQWMIKEQLIVDHPPAVTDSMIASAIRTSAQISKKKP